jgi:hypothetical protein
VFLVGLEGPLGLPKFCNILVIPSNSHCPCSSRAHNAGTRASVCVGTNWIDVVVSRSMPNGFKKLAGTNN